MAMKRFRSVDQFFEEAEYWQAEIEKLREIVRSMPLEETLKWSFPCYTCNGKNIIGIGCFKTYYGIWFFQGGLMDDPDGVLINAQQGKTKGMRQWRMTMRSEIKVRQLKKYIKSAIAVAESGAEIKPDRNRPIKIDPLFASALAENRAASKAFEAMRPGCRREYANYINEAKREQTKVKRIAKILPMIIDGGGLNDKYR